MVEKTELQEKVLAYRILEARLSGLMEQRKTLIDKIAEIQLTQASIDEIKTGARMLVPLGAEAHIFGEVVDDSKIIVEVGAGIALEKTIQEGKELLGKRMEEMKNVLVQVENNIAEVSMNLEKLGPEIQELVKTLSR
ncbi:MAG: prefoldin subunit alpha [Candidatus Aenigmarchaeota archaeon]|nr:prefoldin subunit alpha [Candidatus Aenigmarchaeota archaeon]